MNGGGKRPGRRVSNPPPPRLRWSAKPAKPRLARPRHDCHAVPSGSSHAREAVLVRRRTGGKGWDRGRVESCCK
jgi:hypothetical protein